MKRIYSKCKTGTAAKPTGQESQLEIKGIQSTLIGSGYGICFFTWQKFFSKSEVLLWTCSSLNHLLSHSLTHGCNRFYVFFAYIQFSFACLYWTLSLYFPVSLSFCLLIWFSVFLFGCLSFFVHANCFAIGTVFLCFLSKDIFVL